jgi:DNA-directed RNA polymerase subunit RPC12/RpoP
MCEMEVVLQGDIPEGSYRAWYRCNNCGAIFQHDIQKGQLAAKMDGVCPTCGCKSGTAGIGVFPIVKYNPEHDKQQRYYFK